MATSGNYMLRRPKRSMNEAVAPKEEEEVMFQKKQALSHTIM
jgi:hypothetical protein